MNTRYILPLCFSLALAGSAAAQGPVFGVKAGPSLSNLIGDDIDDQTGRFGFHVGIFGRSEPEDHIGLQVELLYSTKGTQVDYNGPFGIDQTVTLKLDYIELPLMASFRIASVLELHAGLYAAYLLSADASTSGDLGDGSEELDKDNFQSIDVGLLAGVAVNVGPVQIGVRYNYGLSEVADSDGSQAVLGDARNACAQLYVGLGVMK